MFNLYSVEGVASVPQYLDFFKPMYYFVEQNQLVSVKSNPKEMEQFLYPFQPALFSSYFHQVIQEY
jgi:hypothetical protein